jgi:hypothetical protein
MWHLSGAFSAVVSGGLGRKKVGGRGTWNIGLDEFFTFFLELLLFFPCSTPPIGFEPKAGGDVFRRGASRVCFFHFLMMFRG